MLFQQRLHFGKEFLVAAGSRSEECRADFRIALQCRMVEPFDFSPAIGPQGWMNYNRGRLPSGIGRNRQRQITPVVSTALGGY